MNVVNGISSHRAWHSFKASSSGSRLVFVLAAISMVVAVSGIIVRGFQYDTWAWTEFYGDSYYYLAFAKDAARGDFFSYGGISPSSGFHPLHWIFLTVIYAVTGGNQSLMFPIIFAVYAGAFTVTVSAIVYTLRLLGAGAGMLFVVVLAMTYGNYLADALEMPVLVPVIFTNFVNMMESWLLIMSMVLLIAAGVKHLRNSSVSGSTSDWIFISVATMVVVWSRVDYLLVVFPFVAVVAWQSKTLLRWQRIVLVVAAPVAAAGWQLVLLAASGIPISTSGAVKNALLHAAQLSPPAAINYLFENILESAFSLHALIALTGTLVCAVLLIAKVRFERTKRDPVICAFAAILSGMLALFMYHMLFTFPGDIGGWYFRPYRVLMLIIGAYAVSSIVGGKRQIHLGVPTWIPKTIAILALAVIVVSHLNAPGAASDSLARADLVEDVVEQLENSVDPSATFYDGTDGAFGWYGDYTTYHRKGMGNVPGYADIGRNIRLLDLEEMTPIYAAYVDEMAIDYVVTYSQGDISNLEDACWMALPTIAYAQHRLGNRFSYAYATTSSDWLEYLGCLNERDRANR